MTIDLPTPAAAASAAPTAPPLRRPSTSPATPGTTRRASPGTLAVDQRPAAVALPRSAADVAEVVRAAAPAGLRVAPQSTGHNAGPLAAQGLDDVVLVRTSGMDLVMRRPGPRHRARRGRRALAARRRGGRRARLRRAARLLPRRRHRRLLPRRRHRLVRPQARAGHQQPHRRRAGDRRRHAGARRRGHQRRAVLGAARRWRQLRRGHRARVPDVPDRDGVRRHPGVGHRGRRAGAARRGPPGRPTPPTRSPPRSGSCGCRRCPSSPTSCAAARSSSSTAPCSAPTSAGEELLAGLRALRPEIDTFGRVPAASLVRLHMDPEGGAPVASDSAMLGGFPDAAVDAFLAEVGPGATTPLLMAELRQLGGALGRPHAGGGALSHLDAEFVMFAGALAMDAEIGAAGHADGGPAQRGAGAVRERPSVPQLRREPGRRRIRLPRAGLAAAGRDPVARSTPTACSSPTTRSRGCSSRAGRRPESDDRTLLRPPPAAGGRRPLRAPRGPSGTRRRATRPASPPGRRGGRPAAAR